MQYSKMCIQKGGLKPRQTEADLWQKLAKKEKQIRSISMVGNAP